MMRVSGRFLSVAPIMRTPIALALLLWGVSSQSARTEEPPPFGPPRACIGLDPVKQVYGRPTLDADGRTTRCPDGYAYLATGPVSGPVRPAPQISIAGGDCCPLPDGTLLNEHVWSFTVCPDGYVATGERTVGDLDVLGDYNLLKHEIRCTRIDSSRLVLGPIQKGEQYGLLESAAWAIIFGLPQGRTSRAVMPASIRYGLGRMSRGRWSLTGCVPAEIGAVLVGKSGRGCSRLLFRKILFASGTGRTAGSELPILPDCVAVDPMDPGATCLTGARTSAE